MSDHQNHLDYAMGRLQSLDNHEQVLLGLYYFEKLTVGEIANVLQEDPGMVENRLDGVFSKMSESSAADQKASGQHIVAGEES